MHWARLEASALGSLIAACPAWKIIERRERNDVVTYELLYASPIQTGDKVEFNTVDFVESRQSRPAPYTPATKSTATS